MKITQITVQKNNYFNNLLKKTCNPGKHANKKPDCLMTGSPALYFQDSNFTVPASQQVWFFIKDTNN
ncbi:Uncharacterized protein dnl_39780 [Desulfonema limicola]|uniref:Uncharacterized protein n=1 Tax=Desulfonema limicola TaxID=45656 RepID=A0A975BAA0_9BACT|nr:Uncharacterized protein dnl_39780 [Desulfonema limicola]